MVVTVYLHTTLQRRTPEGPQRRLEVTLPPASRLADVLQRLAIPLDDESILLVINGRVAGADQPLADGDEVHLIPALSGGAPLSLPDSRQAPQKGPDVPRLGSGP